MLIGLKRGPKRPNRSAPLAWADRPRACGRIYSNSAFTATGTNGWRIPSSLYTLPSAPSR